MMLIMQMLIYGCTFMHIGIFDDFEGIMRVVEGYRGFVGAEGFEGFQDFDGFEGLFVNLIILH